MEQLHDRYQLFTRRNKKYYLTEFSEKTAAFRAIVDMNEPEEVVGLVDLGQEGVDGNPILIEINFTDIISSFSDAGEVELRLQGVFGITLTQEMLSILKKRYHEQLAEKITMAFLSLADSPEEN